MNTLLWAFWFCAALILAACLAAPAAAAIPPESARELAEAYQMRDAGSAVTLMVEDEVRKDIGSRVLDWTAEAIEETSALKAAPHPGKAGEVDSSKKEAVKQRLKEKIEKHLPALAKKVLYEKLFLGQFGDEVEEIKEVVDRVTKELKVSFNKRADQIIGRWYDEAIGQIDDYLRFKAGPVKVDLTDVRGTVSRAINVNNIEWGITRALSESIGEGTAEGVRKRMKDVLTGRLPPELVEYLDYGPEKFAEMASKIEDNLPGKKFDELKDRLIHTPLFIIPNGVYCGILAISASRHLAQAYAETPLNAIELRRSIEVSRVLIWQANNKDGISVDLASLVSLARTLADQFGISLSDLGRLGSDIMDAKDKLQELEKKLDELDGLVKDNLTIAREKIDGIVSDIKGYLKDVQDTVFRPAIEGYRELNGAIKDARDAVLGAIPKNIYGVPSSWDRFKQQFGIKNGVFGKWGKNSPWSVLQDFLEKSGIKGAYERMKKDVLDAAGKLNEKIADALATGAADAADALGFTDEAGRLLGIEDIPAENPSVENPTEPVLLHNGEFYYQVTDIFIPGRGMDFEFKRTYRSRAAFKGVLGYNWAHNYEERMSPLGESVYYIDDSGQRYEFRRARGHDGGYISPPGIFSVLTDDAAGGYLLAAPDGGKTRFYGTGHMASKEDRFGNKLAFEYDGYARLAKVTDSSGRVASYSYNEAGFLSEVKDFAGRTVALAYDRQGDLSGATSPKTFDWPAGKTIRYAYSTGYHRDEELNHNLTLVMDPKGDIYLRNFYGTHGMEKDRVVAQQYGGGKKMLMQYHLYRPPYLWRFFGRQANEPVDQVVLLDRRGVIRIYEHNAMGNLLSEEFYDELGVKKTKVRHRYDADGMRVQSTFLGGRRVERMFDKDNPSRMARANLLEEKEFPAGGSDPRVTKWSYEPRFNQMKVRINPAGARLTRYYDYEMGDEFGKGAMAAVQIDDGRGNGVVLRYRHNEYGQLTEMAGAGGSATQYEYYPETGWLKSVTKASSTTVFTYDQAGNIIRTTDPEGHSTNYMVNNLGQVIEEISPEPFSYKKRYEFDANGNLRRMKIDNAGGRNRDDVGDVVEYSYEHDILDNLLKETATAGKNKRIEKKYEYDAEGRLTKAITPEGLAEEYVYDAAGRLVRVKGGGGTIIIGRADGENRAWIMNERGRMTKYKLNGFGEITEVEDPLGRRLELSRDALGRVAAEKMFAAGGKLLADARYAFDFLGNTTEVKRLWYRDDPKDGKWVTSTMEYDPEGRVISYKDEGGRVTRYEYNALGLVAAQYFSDGRKTEYGYNASGRVISRREYPADANGRFAETAYSRDELGRMREAAYPDGGRVRFTFDSRNNLVEVTDPIGYGTEYDYDGIGRRVAAREQVDAKKWITTQYSWDGDGRLVSLVDGNGGKTAYGYDALGRLESMTYPDGGTEGYRYDADGNAHLIVQTDGTRIYQMFDAAGRVVGRRVDCGEGGCRGTTFQMFGYDEQNRLIASFDDNDSADPGDDAVNRYYYDSLSNLVAEDQGGLQVAKDVSPTGLANVAKYPSGEVLYRQYDELSRPKAIFWEGSVLGEFSYDPNGRPLATRFGNGLTEAMSYDIGGRIVAGERKNAGGETVWHERFGYNLRGELTSRNSGGAAEAYDYDGVSRLVKYSSVRSPKAGEAGRREEMTWQLDNLGNRLSGGNAVALEYDGRGNLAESGKHRYAYDGLNRLSEVYDGETLVAKYAYDALNRRVSKRLPGEEKRYAYDGAEMVEEYENGSIVRSFIPGDEIDRPVAFFDHASGRKYFYHLDNIGSVAFITDENGDVAEEYRYATPYGEFAETPAKARHAATSSPLRGEGRDAVENKPFFGQYLRPKAGGLQQPLAFTSRVYDFEAGLMYFRNRYYAPWLGRFLTRDPLGYKISLRSEGEAVTPYHLSFHRGGGMRTLPNNFNWLVNLTPAAARRWPQTGIAGFNMFGRRPFALGRIGEMNLYAYAASNPVNLSDPFGLDFLWVTGDYKSYPKVGRYADLDIIWVEQEAQEGGGIIERVKPIVAHAASGPWGRGPLPPGLYKGTNLDEEWKDKGMMIDGFGWRLKLTSDVTIPRSGLVLHPDGGDYFGSLGCIAVDSNGHRLLYERLGAYMEQRREEGEKQEIDVFVTIGGSGNERVREYDELVRSEAEYVTREYYSSWYF